MMCPTCKLRMELDLLKLTDKAEKLAAGGCWMSGNGPPEGEMTITIYGQMTDDQYKRLLDLLVEIQGTVSRET